MVTNEIFRQLALSFPGVEELPHFEKASFRINKKIFATLTEKQNLAVVKLSPTDQSVFCAFDKTVIYPVPGAWGKKGYSSIALPKIRKSMLKDALSCAYRQVAGKHYTL